MVRQHQDPGRQAQTFRLAGQKRKQVNGIGDGAVGGQLDPAGLVVGVDAVVAGHQHGVLDHHDRLEPARLDVSREAAIQAGSAVIPAATGATTANFMVSAQLPPSLLARIASRHSRRVWPVSCIQTRTGVSSSTGSGSSVTSVVTVTVGAGISPWFSDQMEAPVDCRVEQ